MTDPEPTHQTYDGIDRAAWFAELEKHRLDNRKHLYALWALFGTPRTMLDVGCGNGDLVYRARQMGVMAFGVDQLVSLEDGSGYDKGFFVHHDLSMPFSLAGLIEKAPNTVDIVLCWEIAEHILPEAHPIFCDTLCSHLHRGNRSYLIFTSAHPGQGGSKHIGERPATYWREQFHARGLNYMHELSTKVSLMWSLLETAMYWLPANVQVFERG